MFSRKCLPQELALLLLDSHRSITFVVVFCYCVHLDVANGRSYPFSVNTDDPGVFDTDLPSEFVHLATSHKIDRDGMVRLACRAVQVRTV